MVRIAGQIGLAPGAAANILSKTKLIDAGYDVTYDPSADVYQLKGDIYRYTLLRIPFLIVFCLV